MSMTCLGICIQDASRQPLKFVC